MSRIFSPERDLLNKFTGVFKVQGCRYCRFYDWFLPKMNLKLPPKLRFEIIDCTYYHDYGIVTDKRIPIFLSVTKTIS